MSAADLHVGATGATSRTRRALTATTAAALAGLGVALATAGAVVILTVGHLARADRPPGIHLL